jgi:hypothetical protein
MVPGRAPELAALAAGSTLSGVFVGVGVLVLLVGLVVSARRVSRARDLARAAGEDTALATGRAVLGDSFWTRLLRSLLVRLRRRPRSPAASQARDGSVSDQLARLERLRDQGLISPTEYDERRRSILDSL